MQESVRRAMNEAILAQLLQIAYGDIPQMNELCGLKALIIVILILYTVLCDVIMPSMQDQNAGA
jgi:hypothetical protein